MSRVRPKKEILTLGVTYLILSVVGLLILLPLYWMVVSAVKPDTELISIPPTFIPSAITLVNVRRFIEKVSFLRVVANSLIIAGVTTGLSVVVATATGYGLAKFRARGANLIFILMLTSAMVPDFVRILPLYVAMVRVGLGDTLTGVILPFYVSIFAVFFMRQYCQTLADDLLMAARVEGASEVTILFRIVFPVVSPAIAALAILKFLLTWNQFLWPLIMLSSARKMTIQVAIAVLLDLEVAMEYGMIMAGATLAVLPVLILFLLLQRHIITGIALTGMKG
jgi:multiple sugar transport system permease protein